MIDPTRIGVIHECALDVEVTGDVPGTVAEWRGRLTREELKTALRLALLDIEIEKRGSA